MTENNRISEKSGESVTVKCTFPDCGWSKVFTSRDEYLVFNLRWPLFHSHGDKGTFTSEIKYESTHIRKGYREGDVLIFKTQVNSKDGQGNPIIAFGPDGKIAFFDKEAPLTSTLSEKKRVEGVIKVIRPNSIVVTPIRDLGPTERFDNHTAEYL